MKPTKLFLIILLLLICGATHCTGERQTKMFKEAFKTDFIEPGAGNSIEEVHGTFTSGR